MLQQGKFYIKGIEEFERQANKIIKDVHEAKTKILLGQARIVQKAVKNNAPVGPSTTKSDRKRIKNSTYAAVVPPSLTNRRAVAFAGIRPRKAPHAHLVEQGHGGPHPAPPHPFFWPAVASVMDKVADNISKELKDLIEG